MFNTSFASPKFANRDIIRETTRLYADEPANVIMPITEMLVAACQTLNALDRSAIMKHIADRRNYWINYKEDGK